MAGTGTTESMANVLNAAWIAITANSEPVRSYTREQQRRPHEQPVLDEQQCQQREARHGVEDSPG